MSSIICRVPSARVAAKEEPYSTNRPSPWWYQVMPGMREPTGCSPVTIAERQTGVSDGNVETQVSVREPAAASAAIVGARPAAIARSRSSGPRPSTTARTTFFFTSES